MDMKEKILKYIRHKPLTRKILSKVYLSYIKLQNSFKEVKFEKLYYVNPSDINNIS